MLLGVTGKSAQLPLYVWLPDAMAGPTPVSALIHAATMVTAGVYLVARSHAIYAAAPAAQAAVMWVGTLTALFAATIAVGQFDIKRVLAYSTISQLGFMVAAVGMGAYVAGMFHLVTHAFFKALLFLAAGSVILGMESGHAATAGHAEGHEPEHDGPRLDTQDMRFMGGLRSRMGTTFWVFLAGALALAGVAPLAGFFSKDEILVAARMTSPLLYILLTLSALLTAFYVGRQVLMVFYGKARSEAAQKAVESPPMITVPLIILAALAILGGVINFPGILTLEHWLEHTIEHSLITGFDLPVAGISLLVALGGLALAWAVYGRSPLAQPEAPDPVSKKMPGLFNALHNKWWVDEFYNAIVVRPYQRLANFLAHPIDQGGIDAFANGLGALTQQVARMGSRLESGYIRAYTMAVLVGVVFILAYLALR